MKRFSFSSRNDLAVSGSNVQRKIIPVITRKFIRRANSGKGGFPEISIMPLWLRRSYPSLPQSRQPLPCQVGYRPRKCRRAVQGFRALQPDTYFDGIFAKQNIHVKKNLHMVAKKTDRLQDNSPHTRRSDCIERRLNRRPNPRAAARPLALKGKPPLRNLRNAFRHQGRRSLGFFRVRVSALPWPQPR